MDDADAVIGVCDVCELAPDRDVETDGLCVGTDSFESAPARP